MYALNYTLIFSVLYQIILIGAGKSSTVLIDYLKTLASEKNWKIAVADFNVEIVKSKLGNQSTVDAIELDILNDLERARVVQQSKLIISLLPPDLHYLLAIDCIQFKKHLLTASYIDTRIQLLSNEIEKAGVLFLCEMGLDPGIDHMSAMKIIHSIKNKAGQITEFISHCGGLVAPESDDNPWHYKISWNPKNIVLAGKNGAVYKLKNENKTEKYQDIFCNKKIVKVKDTNWGYYPNRDSLNYINLYNLNECSTFLRTTLRHINYIEVWCKVVNLQLTDENFYYDTDILSFKSFFKKHFERFNFSLESLNKKEKELFEYLGFFTNDEIIGKGNCSAADIMQYAMEKYLNMLLDDKDMIVMFHEIYYTLGKKKFKIESSLEVKGVNNLQTAMAKTVGLPLGIAAKNILEGKIKVTGLHIPVLFEFYDIILKELETFAVKFEETEMEIL